METQRLVFVASTVDGAPTTQTGYVIGPDLILTTSHGLGDDARVRIGRTPGRDAEVAWRGDAPDQQDSKVDAALLRYAAEPGESFRPVGWRTDPVGGEVWSTSAYAVLGESLGTIDDALPRAVALRGKVQGSVEMGQLQLGVDYAPSEGAGLAGASGAPVVIDAQLAGLVDSIPATFSDRLLATPIGALLERDDFRKQLGSRGEALHKAYVAWVRARLGALLGRSKELRRRFASELGVESAGEITAELLEVDALEVLTILRRVGNRLPSDDGETLEEVLSLLGPSLDFLIPLLDDAFDALLSGGLFLETRLETTTMLEALMANADLRPARFELHGKDVQESAVSIGLRLDEPRFEVLGSVPERGVSPEEFIAAVRRNLFEDPRFRFEPEEREGFKTGRFTAEQIDARINVELELLSSPDEEEDERGSLYCVLDTSEGQPASDRKLRERLASTYPRLRFVGLNLYDADHVDRRELTLRSTIQRILRKARALQEKHDELSA